MTISDGIVAANPLATGFGDGIRVAVGAFVSWVPSLFVPSKPDWRRDCAKGHRLGVSLRFNPSLVALCWQWRS